MALLLSWLVASLRFPPGRDQGVFLWIGDVVSGGGAPYRDAWETKGPFVFMLSAVVRTMFGASSWGIRFFDGAVVLGTLALVVVLLRQAGARTAAHWSALVMAIAYTRLGWWDSAQPETWATACMTGAVVVAGLHGSAAAADRQRVARLLLAGLLVGCAALVKPFFALFIVIPALVVASRDPRRRWTSLALLVAGSFLALAVTLLWFVSFGAGVVAAFIETHLRFNASVYVSLGGITWWERVTLAGSQIARSFLLPSLLLAFAAWGVRGEGERRLASVCAVWLALALAWVLIQGKLWLYQWTPCYPPLAMLAGLGARSLWNVDADAERRAAASRVLVAALALWIAAGAVAPGNWIAAWARDTVFTRDARRWNAHFGKYDLDRGSYAVIARHLRDAVPPEKQVLVWGMEPVIYALSGRASPSRYGVNIPLVLGADTPARRAARDRFAADLAARPPAAIVVLENDRNQLLPKSSRELMSEVPELRELLARSYGPGRRFPDARVYRLKGS